MECLLQACGTRNGRVPGRSLVVERQAESLRYLSHVAGPSALRVSICGLPHLAGIRKRLSPLAARQRTLKCMASKRDFRRAALASLDCTPNRLYCECFLMLPSARLTRLMQVPVLPRPGAADNASIATLKDGSNNEGGSHVAFPNFVRFNRPLPKNPLFTSRDGQMRS